MFVQALFTQAVDHGVFLVPQAAVQRDIGGDAFVFLVGDGQQGRAAQGRRRPHLRHQLGGHAAASSARRQGDHAGHRQPEARRADPAGPGERARSGSRRGRPEPAAASGRRRRLAPCRASSSIGRSSPGCWRSSSCSPASARSASLPIEQYPDIAPPQVNIRASYPGAIGRDDREQRHPDHRAAADRASTACSISARTSSSRGQVNISVVFEKGTDPDIAQVQVQNQVQQAISRLPAQVQQQGVRVTKSNPDFLLIVGVYDETDQRTNMDVSDYLASNIQDPLSRVPGVGDVNVFGAPHAMRIWLNPQRLAAFSLMPSDVDQRDPGAEYRSRGGRGRRPARAAGPDAQRDRHGAVAAADARAVRARSSSRPSPSGATVRLERRRAGRARRGELQLRSCRVNGHPGAGIADLARARRGRAEDGRAGQGPGRASSPQNFPEGLKLRLRQRHHRLSSSCRSRRW